MEFDLYAVMQNITAEINLILLFGFACLILLIWNILLIKDNRKINQEIQKNAIKIVNLEETIYTRISKGRINGNRYTNRENPYIKRE